MRKQPPTVVLLDDESDLLWVLGDALEEEGLHVRALDHPDLIEELEGDGKPAVFVLDLLLPDLDGVRLAQILQSDGYQGVPMIAISGSEPMIRAARSSGLFYRVMTKPFETAEVVEAVRSAALG